MNKFLYKIEKNEKEECIELELFYSNLTNLSTEIKKDTLPYSIILKKADFESLNIKSDKIILANQEIKDKNSENLIKIEIKSQELYKYLLNQVKEREIKTFEADLLDEHRYLIEKNLEIMSNTSQNTIKQELNLKYLVLDIETIGNMENLEIISISTYSPQSLHMSKVYINQAKLKDKDILNTIKSKDFATIILENEEKVLEMFKKDIVEFAPQLITGWNVIDFDFKVIRERMKYYNIEFKFSQHDTEECKLRINSDFFKDSTMQCTGTLIFDTITLLKTNFINFPDYKLDTVAKEVLNEGKIELETDDDDLEEKIKIIENMFYNNPDKLIEYNFKDSILVSQIIEKLNLISLMMKRSIVTGTPFLKVKSPIAALDIMYLKQLHKRKLIAESNFNYNTTTQIEGAYVINPKKNFYKDIFVLDFKSLYPSIIMTFNIDPFTISKNGLIKAPNGSRFDKKSGILPELILKIYKERDIAKKEKDDIKSHALKITMNSFYGAMASNKSRFYNREVGGTITAFARYIIQKAAKYIESLGHTIIYGDTDSIFIKFNKEFKSIDEKKSFGKEIEAKINDYFSNWVENEYKQKNYLEIELEKVYSNFFIASKKRYVGFDEFKQKLQFVGMEAIRGDWTDLAKDFQIELVKQIFAKDTKDEIIKFIKKYVEKLKEGKLDDKLIYLKKITKPLKDYTKTTPPHVKAARELENFEGRVVKYIMTIDGPKHINLITKETKYDYNHYIEKQVKGVSDDLLEIFGINFDEITQSKEQKNLNRFF